MKFALIVLFSICMYIMFAMGVAIFLTPLLHANLPKFIGLPLLVFIISLPPVAAVGYLYEQ